MKNLLILLFTFGFVIAAIPDLFSQESDKLFQKGIIKEEGEGNLEEAIEIYSKVVNDELADRNLRAKALMQVGICYEKLGKENALAAYEKLVSEFSDQQEFVSLARRKLDQLKLTSTAPVNSGIGIQQLKKGLHLAYILGSISPDGSAFLYVDQVNNDDEIVKFDLNSNTAVKLTDNNTSAYGAENSSFPGKAIWSPDGEQIAYIRGVYRIAGKDVDLVEIRMMDKNGENDRILISGPENEIPQILSFTPDGKNILCVLEKRGDGLNHSKLLLFSLSGKTFHPVKETDEQFVGPITYSPNGKYILFTKIDVNQNLDVYVMDMSTLEEHQITFNRNKDWGPSWSPDGDQILFLSDRLGSTDAYRVGFSKGGVVGKPVNIKAGLGDKINIKGVDKDGAVYFSAQNERSDILSINMEELFNTGKTDPVLINDPTSKTEAYVPKFSKDGRYISYLNTNGVKERPLKDTYLGEKYSINIYDTQTGKNSLLDIDLHISFYTRELLWRSPDWSYDNTKLLVYGAVKDNYQGGFYTVDVNTEEVTPVYTKPGHKKGTNYKRLGNMGIFSRDNSKIYYTSPDFKELREFNLSTKEEKLLISNNDGFWFHGFIDEEETKCIALNRFGYFFHDIRSNTKNKFAGKEDGQYLGKTDDGKFYFLLKDENIIKISTDESVPDQSVSIASLIENMIIMASDIRFDGKEMVLSVLKTTGKEVNKIVNAFD